MSLVIKGGTIVAADRTYKADVLVEGETVQASALRKYKEFTAAAGVAR